MVDASWTPDTAIAHGERLLAEGADWLDVGAESSNPAGLGGRGGVTNRAPGPGIETLRVLPARGSLSTRTARR